MAPIRKLTQKAEAFLVAFRDLFGFTHGILYRTSSVLVSTIRKRLPNLYHIRRARITKHFLPNKHM